jgi:ABC-type transporter Mla subunit MlaD
MRRLTAFAIAIAIVAGLSAVALGSSASGSSQARFDVILDDARGLVGGQLVKIAGANAGTIANVVVTPDFKARVEAVIDSRFMPFHQDATCAIRPQGLIAENYVDCDPGTSGSPALRASGRHPPTVPVTRTSEPVSLLDLFNIFNLPTRERFMVLIDELGVGTAGRGEDLNYVLLRANPALAAARRAISILANQRAELQTLLDATNKLLAEGAAHTGTLQAFLDRAAGLTSLTSGHRDSLSLAIARLPGLLAAAEPTLQQLDTVAVESTPLLEQVGAAVPSLNRVARDLGPFAAAAKPGLAALGGSLSRAIAAIRDTTPLVGTLRAYGDRSLTGTVVTSALLKNLQQHGFIENFLSIAYYISASVARFDSTSHVLTMLLTAAQNGKCGDYATVPVPGCSAHYGSRAAYKPQARYARLAERAALFGSTRQSPGDLRSLSDYLLK